MKHAVNSGAEKQLFSLDMIECLYNFILDGKDKSQLPRAKQKLGFENCNQIEIQEHVFQFFESEVGILNLITTFNSFHLLKKNSIENKKIKRK